MEVVFSVVIWLFGFRLFLFGGETVNAIREHFVRLHVTVKVVNHSPLDIITGFVRQREVVILAVSVNVFVLDNDILDAVSGGQHGHLAEGVIGFGLGGFVFHVCIIGDEKAVWHKSGLK